MTDPVKAKIQEMCPDIMELKFGCEVIIKWQTNPKVSGVLFRTFLNGENDVVDVKNKIWSTNPTNKKCPQVVEILGRPITLADVLLAIQKHKGKFVDHDNDKSISDGIDDLNETTLALLGFWNLTKNYDDQDQPTKDFIGSLLGV